MSEKKEIINSIKEAYDINLSSNLPFTRDRYRNIAQENDLSSESMARRVFGTWSKAVQVALEPNRKEAAPIAEVNELCLLGCEEEVSVPLVVKREVPHDQEYKIGILPDIHIPFHSQESLECAIRALEEFQPDEVVQLGDLLDFHGLSKYHKSTYRKSNTTAEINQGKELLKEIKRRTGAKKCTFLEGNHEARLRKYVLNESPSLADIDGLRINKVLDLKNIGWDFVDEHRFYRVNDLFFTHGEFASIHAIKKHIDEYRVNLVHGHTHRLSSRYHRGLDKTILGWELGCLASFGVAAEYTKRANWQHGFGTAIVKGHDAWVEGHHIINGKVAFNGKIISGE